MIDTTDWFDPRTGDLQRYVIRDQYNELEEEGERIIFLAVVASYCKWLAHKIALNDDRIGASRGIRGFVLWMGLRPQSGEFRRLQVMDKLLDEVGEFHKYWVLDCFKAADTLPEGTRLAVQGDMLDVLLPEYPYLVADLVEDILEKYEETPLELARFMPYYNFRVIWCRLVEASGV